MKKAIVQKDLKEMSVEINFLPTSLVEMLKFLYKKHVHNKAITKIYKSMNAREKNPLTAESIDKDMT